MEPIVPIVKTSKPKTSAARGTSADLIAAVIAAAAAIVTFTYSVRFFLGFLENDTQIWGVLSAFLLCFGVGAFAYIPAALTSRIAWTSYKKGAAKNALRWTIVMLLPWCLLSCSLFFVSDMSKIYSLPTLITVALLCAWALISLRKIKTR